MFLFAAVRAADVIVVVSGTDGALPSVVAGLVETPVVSNIFHGGHVSAKRLFANLSGNLNPNRL